MTKTLAPSLAQVEVTALKGVGKQLAEKLTKINIHTIQDVLFHLPLRYMDRTRITPIGSLQPNSDVVLEGEVRGCDVAFGRRRSLVCRVQDGTGTITLRFFHFSAAQKNKLVPGSRVRCYGEARRGSSGLELYHPEYSFIEGSKSADLEHQLTPVYPTVEGLSQQRLRSLSTQAVELLQEETMQDLLPPEWTSFGNTASLADILRYLHHPPADAPLSQMSAGIHPYQQRLALEELLAHQMSMLRVRARLQSFRAPQLPSPTTLLQKFEERLEFTLTGAQQRVAHDIAADLVKPYPMLRLIQGDVGSGKTVVAALAALHAVGNGRQVAIMAPTEILAQQHRHSFNHWFEPLGIQVGWLTGRQGQAVRRQQLSDIQSGATQVVVGTHALFQTDVVFADLGLAIIDEQHRFGVHQRLALKEKSAAGNCAHQLIMTATPIPRTLAMSAYADLDYSIIDELPPGRTPVTTVAISQDRREEVIQRVRNACLQGRQTYWVCTLIEESEVLQASAAEAIEQSLKLSLPELTVGLIHGRLKPAEKERCMQSFKDGEIQLLVATTVIEVGVDVPNASLMIIENPERLGLAQLHQLRGRVGRGQEQSHCVLLYGAQLGDNGRQRLQAMREHADGFAIAEIDLELRGPGEVLGTRQTGDIRFRIADLQRDSELLHEVKHLAARINLEKPENCSSLIDRWLGNVENYVTV
jgi:ATP-dependent DNA helicase RecG